MKFKKLVLLDEMTLTEEQMQMFTELTEELSAFNESNPKSKEETIERAEKADAVIMRGVTVKLDKEFFNACNNLKYVGIWSTGFNSVDIKYAREKGVTVTNVPGYADEAVAEFVFGQILAFFRKSRETDEEIKIRKSFGIKNLLGEELQGKRIGIIGMGEIGERVAELAKAFRMELVYFNRSRKEELEEKLGMEFMELEKLLESSDIITIHAPLNEATKDLIGEKEMDLMKDNAVVVNTARAGIINKEALMHAVQKKRINFILDVYHEEPLPENDEIRQAGKNTLLSPHIAFYTKQALERMTKTCVENAKAFLGGKPKNTVN